MTINLTKTYKKVHYDIDTNTWSFVNKAPEFQKSSTYRLSTILDTDQDKITLLEGAELLLKKMREQKRKMTKDYKWLTTDPANYKGTYEYVPERGLIELPEQIEKRNQTIKTWSKLVKSIKSSPEYVVHVLKN